MPLDRETILKKPNDPVTPLEHWKYNGLTGALQYGLLQTGIVAVASVVAALAI